MAIEEPILVTNSCAIKDQSSIDQDLAEAPQEVAAFVGRAWSRVANTVQTAPKCRLRKETIEHRSLMLSMVLRNPERLATPDVSTYQSHLSFYFCSVATRFTNQGRVSAAIYDNTMQESPNRLNPNQVLRRERAGAID